ncbi:MAG: PIN domain-containing protein [Phycisphaerae bacterium]|nr:PIN domain-containing protein [Phycisphaerae bacterium]
MKHLRVYADTSVLGGCFDEEFAEASRTLLDLAQAGELTVLISDLTLEELEQAPVRVRDLVSELPEGYVEPLVRDGESVDLRDAYLKAGVVGERSSNDALHVALASVAKADLIVSWNFRHIVHIEKIRGFNAVNLREGYPMIDIRSPREVV